jgi:hypothetical protein
MQTVALRESRPITLDGSGAGIARLGPASHGEIWHPETVSVKCSANVLEASCRIYAGDSATDSNFVDATLSGSTGDSTDRVNGPMWLGHYVFAVWAAGDAGATATLVVQGSREIQ